MAPIARILRLRSLLVLLLWAAQCEAFKALVATTNIAFSHVQFSGKLADLLVAAGHDVHMFVHVWDPNEKATGSRLAQKVTRYIPSNAKEIYAINDRIAFKRDHFASESLHSHVFTHEQARLFADGTVAFCKALLADKKFIQELRNDNYRVGVADDACTFALFHLLDIPTVIISSPVATSEFIVHPLGLSAPPSYVAEVNTASHSAPDLNYFERIANMYRVLYRSPSILDTFDSAMTPALRQLVPGAPSFNEMLHRASYIFVNSHEMLDIARPTSAKIKQIGGVTVEPPNALSGHLREVVESAPHGVVYFSFGSVVQADRMPASIREAFLKSFAKFTGFHFVWKTSGAVPKSGGFTQRLFANASNVFYFDWVDQTALLAHPKTKAFITHCGLNSLNEAAHFGRPMLVVPFFGDQHYNAAIVRHKRIGIPIRKSDITEEAVTNALRKLLFDESYRANAELVRQKLRTSPFTPSEIFIKWTEYAAQFDDHLPDLNLASAKMSFTTFYCLDIIVPAVFLALIGLYFLLRLLATARVSIRVYVKTRKLE